MGFVERVQAIAFGGVGGDRVAGIQTPGGTGALRLCAELAKAARATSRVWLGLPSWPNHAPIFQAAGLEVATYSYYDVERQVLLFDEMMHALASAEPGDLVLLHGCCHNPTGADLAPEQWAAVGHLLERHGLVPLVDLAYQGLGLGLDEDARGLRHIVDAVGEALVAYSCDKNFGLYRDRAGAAYAVGRGAEAARVAQSNLSNLARLNWSMPPDHGAAVVRLILESADLMETWTDELRSMCWRINGVRAALAEADPCFDCIEQQRGLFANLALSESAVLRLRVDHGIYLVGSGRVNLAGLRVHDVPRFVAALRTVAAPIWFFKQREHRSPRD